VVLWTVLGTLGCIAVAFWFDSFNFPSLDETQLFHAVLTDLFVPLTLGPPVFIFFSTKLRELAIAHYRLAILASTDSLTEVLNRGAFTAQVEAYLGNARGPARPGGALLVIDVDHFKQINDSYGHDCGDDALRLVASTIRNTLRSGDLMGRLGGEEFGVFLPGASTGRAMAAAERIRQAISEAEFAADSMRQALSVSVGGATFVESVPFRALYREADRLLYQAKNLGRNRVAFSGIAGEVPQAA
jgi:diguanylate cyclase (GGDEF)-like protein